MQKYANNCIVALSLKVQITDQSKKISDLSWSFSHVKRTQSAKRPNVQQVGRQVYIFLRISISSTIVISYDASQSPTKAKKYLGIVSVGPITNLSIIDDQCYHVFHFFDDTHIKSISIPPLNFCNSMKWHSCSFQELPILKAKLAIYCMSGNVFLCNFPPYSIVFLVFF